MCAAVMTLAVTAALSLTGTAAQAATTLCNSQTASVAGGAYIVENNEWNSSASECVATDGNADFSVANSSISNAAGGAPGGYPAIYKGCHWGACTSNSGLPIQVGSLTPGKVTTSWTTTQTGAGAYVTLGGHTYNIWEDQMSTWKDVSYVMTSGTTSVSNLDVGILAADSVSRGYMTDSDYLIDLEAGFELWQGGTGLATDSYSVNINAGGGTSATGQVVGYEGLCLDDRGASTAEYNPIQVYTCNGTGAQQWTVEPNNTLDVLGMCLDVDGAGTANGTLVDLYSCNGTSAQVWEPQPDGALLNPNSGKCLDDTGYGGSGTQVQIWSCSGNANQSWILP
jgi:hypothetical protein